MELYLIFLDSLNYTYTEININNGKNKMKIDLYTKGILTVIALSLLVMAFKDVDPINSAFAHSGGVHKIAICDSTGYNCTKIVNGMFNIYN